MSALDAAKKFVEAKMTKTSDAHVQANFSLHIGPPGSGKTSILGTMPGKTLILDTEGGTAPLRDKDIDLIQIATWRDLRQAMVWLEQGTHDYNSVGLDGLTRFQRLLKDAILDAHNKNFMDQKLWGKLLDKGMAFIDALDQIRTTRNIHIAVTVLEQLITDDERGTVVAATPKLAGGLKDEIIGMFDTAVFHRTKQLEPREDEDYGEIIFKCLTKPYDIDGCKRIAKDRWGVLDLMEDPDISSWVTKAEEAQGEKVSTPDPTPPSALDTDAVSGKPIVDQAASTPSTPEPTPQPEAPEATADSSAPEPDSSPTPSTETSASESTAATANGEPDVTPEQLHGILREWYDSATTAFPHRKKEVQDYLRGLCRTAGKNTVTEITDVSILMKIIDEVDVYGKRIQQEEEQKA